MTIKRAAHVAALLYIAQAAFGAAAPIRLSLAPPSAVVGAPQAAAAFAAQPGFAPAFAAPANVESEASVLSAAAPTPLVPQALTAAEAPVAAAPAADKPAVIDATRELGASLGKQAARNDDAGTARTLNATFDASAPVETAAAPDETAGPAAPPLRTGVRGAPRGSKRAPPAPSSDGTAAAPANTWEKAKPLPVHVDLQSALPSLDAAYEMHVSHSYPGQLAADPAELLLQDVKDYIAYKGVPNAQKHFIFKYFEIGDAASGHSKPVQAVELLVRAGIKTTILTDFNQSVTGTFPNDELHNTDFEHVAYKESGTGRAFKYFREGLGFGLKYGEGKFAILSGVPLFNPRDKGEKPLMHDKGYVAVGAGGKAYEFAGNGTANMNALEETSDGPLPSHGGRYNRVMRSKDPVANQVDLDHVMGEIEAYNQRLSSKGLAEELNVPKRVNYPNGEFREIAFTNGKQNPNDRIVDALNRATKSLQDAMANKTQPDFEIEEVVFSHFVLTDSPEVDALRKWLDALRAFYPNDYQARAKIFGVFDQQFIAPDGFGEAAALDGILVQRPMGRSIFPFRSEYLAMMKLHGYLRLLGGVDKIDPDAAPTKIHLWHDKTTVMKVKENGKSWTYAWTRSLNNSGHFQSLESQDMYRMLPDSKLARDFEDSIKKVAEAEPQYAIDLDKAIVTVVLAHLTHHTAYDAGIQERAAKLISPAAHLNYQLVESLLTEIADLPTKHVKAVDGAAVKAKIAQFVGFLQWYADETRKDRTLSEMTYRKAINIGVGLAAAKPYGLRTALDILYWGPHRTPEQMEALMKRAWTEGLKMTAPYPEPKPAPGAASA